MVCSIFTFYTSCLVFRQERKIPFFRIKCRLVPGLLESPDSRNLPFPEQIFWGCDNQVIRIRFRIITGVDLQGELLKWKLLLNNSGRARQ
jgi:hypothetical protein